MTRAQILKLLTDGAFHSGTDIGARLGVSRAAVCKSIRSLAEAGLEIESVTGRGYRMPVPARPLERRAIQRHLAEAGIEALSVRILDEVDSTSAYLLAEDRGGPQSRVCLAEAQPQGRGRRGRHWVATPYHNVMLSMSWQFAGGPTTIAGLSLAAGLAVLRALERYGVSGGRSRHPASRDTGTSLHGAGLGLKWPNDILCDGRKLAGLLVDMQGEADGPTRVVLGVGVNGYIGARDAARIDQPWTDVQRVTGESVDRNRLAALAIAELFYMFETFAESGFAPFRREWERRHHYHERRVRLIHGATEVLGTVAGVDASGALLLRDAHGGQQAYHAGEISLRPA
jgi:BirA family biotin operon repressor/biotin-[acetyl-CoA-carboxylase] ligase